MTMLGLKAFGNSHILAAQEMAFSRNFPAAS
jgi:hypothetical protein